MHDTNCAPMALPEKQHPPPSRMPLLAVLAPATTALAALAASLGRSQSVRAAPAFPLRAARAGLPIDLWWPARSASAQRIPMRAYRAAARRRHPARPYAAGHAPLAGGSTDRTPAPG